MRLENRLETCNQVSNKYSRESTIHFYSDNNCSLVSYFQKLVFTGLLFFVKQRKL